LEGLCQGRASNFLSNTWRTERKEGNETPVTDNDDLEEHQPAEGIVDEVEATCVVEEGGPAPYWASVSKKTKFRRLHRTGGCHVQAESCTEWLPVQVLGEQVADAYCKFCWPSGVVSVESSDCSESSSDSDSSQN
jgi:hypothetical protein